jgi:hypothetical protein
VFLLGLRIEHLIFTAKYDYPYAWSNWKKKHLLPCNAVKSARLHGITSQNIALFIITAVRTSNPILK